MNPGVCLNDYPWVIFNPHTAFVSPTTIDNWVVCKSKIRYY